MKYIQKFSVRLACAVIVGFLLAGAVTKITYTCPPVDGAEGCVSFEKAIMHPADLADNKQDSLVNFSRTFVVTSLISFALLSALNAIYKKRS